MGDIVSSLPWFFCKIIFHIRIVDWWTALPGSVHLGLYSCRFTLDSSIVCCLHPSLIACHLMKHFCLQS